MRSPTGASGSSFRMVTSIARRTTSKLFHEDSVIASGVTLYDIYEKITKGNMACDASEMPTDTVKAAVELYIEGAPFATPSRLPSGTSYGGITVFPDFTGVIIDKPSITGLPAGTYLVHYFSTKNRAMEGVLTFAVIDRPKIDNPVKTAVYFADNGRGAVDQAEIYFTDTLRTLPDSLLLCWPSIIDCKLVAGGEETGAHVPLPIDR